MKKFWLIGSVIAIACIAQILTVNAAPYYPVQGGTGTSTIPQSGQVLVGNASGTYSPAYILCAGTCQVATSSGGVTITGTGVATNTGNWAGTWQLYNPSDFLSSSTQIVNSVNGLSGVITITSSSLGVVWPTVNGNKATAYNIVPGSGATSTVSGATTTISVALDNGSTQSCSANQFIDQVTSSGIVTCGSITFPTAATYTFVNGGGLLFSQATSSTNTTTTVTLNINNGSVQTCTTGQDVNSLSALGIISCNIAVHTLDGVNTSTITFLGSGGSIATTTNSITFMSVSTSTANTWTALQTFTQGVTINGQVMLASTTNALLLVNGSGQVAGFAGSTCGAGNAPTGVSATGTVQNCTAYLTGNQSVTLTIGGDATGTASGATTINDSIQVTGLLGKSLPSLATGTLEYTGGAWTLGAIPPTYSFAAGTGESVSQSTSGGNTTTTYTNTGVTSFTGQGCVTASNSTGTVSLTVTCISGNQTITFTMAGDATGTASGATSITDSITVTGLNGKALPANTTGTLQYVGNAWVINLATSSLGLYNASGTLSSYLGSSCSGGQYVTGFSATGTVACGTPGGGGTVTSITGSNSIVASPSSITTTGNISLASSTASGTIFIGSGNGMWAITLPTSTSPLQWTYGSGTLSLACSPACLTGNQTITITASGDATGTASGSTSINDSLTITGLQGKALPSVATGTLYYSGGAWHLGNAVDLNNNQYQTSTSYTAQGTTITTTNLTVATSGPLLTASVSGNTLTLTSISTSTILSGYATSTGITGGSCTNCNLTYNGNGSITIASNGSGGSGGGVATSSPTNANYDAIFQNTSTITNGIFYESTSTNSFTVGTTTQYTGYGGYLYANNPASSTGLQFVLQNGATSSWSEFVVTADNGNTSTNYGGFGINNSQLSTSTRGYENPDDTFLEGTNGLDLEPCITGATSSQCLLTVFLGGNASSNVKMVISTSSVQLGSTTYLNIPALSNALAVISSTGTIQQYTGTGPCAAGQAMTTLSAPGGQTCAAFGSSNVSTSTANTWTALQTFSGGASSTNITSTFVQFTNATGTGLSLTSGTTTYLQFTNATGSTLNVTTGTFTTATTTQINFTSASGTNETLLGYESVSGNVYLPNLASQNCLGTGSGGVVQAGTCSGGSGVNINQAGASSTYSFTLNATTSPPSITTSTATLNLNVSNQAQVPTIIVSSQPGANYASTSIKAALVAACNTSTYPNGANVFLPDKNYTVTSTGVGAANAPLFLCAGVSLMGNLRGGTYINWAAPGTSSELIAASGTTPIELSLQNLTLNQTSGSYAGYAIDASNWDRSLIKNIETFTFLWQGKINDTANLSFYNDFQDLNSFDDNGWNISSTNPVNDNIWLNDQMNINQDGAATAAKPDYGVYFNDGQDDTFQQFTCEPATQASTICFDGQSVNADDVNLIGTWFEGAATGTILNNTERVNVIGGNWNGNTANFQRNGDTGTTILNLDNNFGNPITEFSSLVTAGQGSSLSSSTNVGCYGFVPNSTSTEWYIGVATGTSSGSGFLLYATSTKPTGCN